MADLDIYRILTKLDFTNSDEVNPNFNNLNDLITRLNRVRGARVEHFHGYATSSDEFIIDETNFTLQYNYYINNEINRTKTLRCSIDKLNELLQQDGFSIEKLTKEERREPAPDPDYSAGGKKHKSRKQKKYRKQKKSRKSKRLL